MRKKHRSTESDEPLSEGRVEYLEAARQRTGVDRRIIPARPIFEIIMLAAAKNAAMAGYGIRGSSSWKY